jgi:uncharacterized FAD-dependent dehydrogenase
MGGGKLVAPVQRITDFLEGKIGGPGGPITSSYRMGVKEAACHTIYPEYVTEVSDLPAAGRHTCYEIVN